MSNDNYHHPPNNHHQPSSPTTSNHHLHGFTALHLPQTPSSSSSPTTNTTETSTTPESQIAAAIGRAISTIKSNSVTTTTTTTPNDRLARQLSDATSSVTQYLSTTTTTPPKIPMQNVLPHASTDTITNERQGQPHARNMSHKPVRRAISDAVEYHHQQPPQKTRTSPARASSSLIATPESSAGKRSPQMEKMKKIGDLVKEIEQRCLDIIGPDEDDIPDPVKPKEQEECVGVDRLKNGDLKFVFSCACGKRFEMLLKNNGYCFYKLT